MRLLQSVILYLNRVVESFKNTNTLGAQLQVNQPFHAQKDAMMLHSFLTHHHNDPRNYFLSKNKKTQRTIDSCCKTYCLAKIFNVAFLRR